MKQLISVVHMLRLAALLCVFSSMVNVSAQLTQSTSTPIIVSTRIPTIVEPYTHELTQLVVEYVELVKEASQGAYLSRSMSNWYDSIQAGKEVFLDDIKEAISELINYLHFKLTPDTHKAPRPADEDIAQEIVGPGSCQLAGLLTFLENLQIDFTQCCQEIQEDIAFTNSVFENIDLNLDITLSTFEEFAVTFSTFQEMVVDIQNSLTGLVVVVNQFANTVTFIQESISGTFTAFDACCQELTLDFEETGTIITTGFSSIFEEIQTGFNSTTTSFVGTWTLIQAIKNTFTTCQCIEEFESTWTIINDIIENTCLCESEFQQTWTLLANISDIVGDVCACISEFQQTWTIIQAGFNGTSTSFQETFTALQAGFQGTWSLIEDLTLCGFVSVFNDEIVSTRNDLISIQFPYGVSSFDTTTSTFAGGFVNSFTSMAIIGTGTGATAFAQLRSLGSLAYRAGHEADLFFTAMFPNGGAATSTQWIGLFDETDGMAVGFNNTTFSILYRNNGVDTIVPQSSFNVDPLDGTGPSGFTLNPQTLNVYRIVYGWVGAGPIVFQITDQNGEWVTFHQIFTANTVNGPNLSNPYLPITAQVRKTAGASDIRIATASWNASAMQERLPVGNRYFAVQTDNAVTITSTTEQHILTIRNKSNFQSKPNKISLRVCAFTGGPEVMFATSGNGFFNFRRQATLSGGSFTDVNTANSIVEYSLTGNYVVGTGLPLFTIASNVANGKTPPITLLAVQDANITIYPGETLTITYVSKTSPFNLAMYASLTWEELF